MDLELLYDQGSTMFENVRKGPPKFSKKTSEKIESLINEIDRLVDSGAFLESDFFGKKIGLPFGISAGAAYGSKFLGMYEKLGYGFLTQKTVRMIRWEGNPMPHVMSVGNGDYHSGFLKSENLTTALSNSFGMCCLGPDFWEDDLRKFVKRSKVPLVLSGVVTKPQDREDVIHQYAELAKKAKDIGAVAYEANVSCPNEMEGHSGELQDDNDLCFDIVRESKKAGINVFIKIGFRENMEMFVEKVGRVVDGIVAINTKSAQIKDEKGRFAYTNREKAGVSGEPLKTYAENALLNILKLRSKMGYRFRVLSVGGVTKPEDVRNRLNAGADFVESSAMAMLYPPLALEVKKLLLESSLK